MTCDGPVGSGRAPSPRRVLLAGCCALAMACSRVDLPPPTRALVFEEADSGRSVVLPVGAAFDVRLSSRPGTGYAWDVGQVDRGVVVERDPAGSAPMGPPRPGSAARETFHFRGPGRRHHCARARLPAAVGARRAAPRTFRLEVTVR